jgi:hypothetical protein
MLDERRLTARTIRPARHLRGAPNAADPYDIVVHADAAGAARLMREIVALRELDVALEEKDGHWQVVVGTHGHVDGVLARVIDVTAHCVGMGWMAHATLCLGKRSYTIHNAGPIDVPAAAA